MTPPSDSLGPDSMVWGLEPTGKFTIRSAYLLLTDLQEEQPDPRWKRIWKWQGPNKIRHFLWLASHNRLLTNEERGRRHLTNQVLCSFCSDHTESCIHILRDCRFAKQFWSKIMPQVISGEELSKDGSNWLDTHVCHREERHTLTFGVGVWLLWRARNKRLFEQDTESYLEVAHRCDYWVALITSSWKTGQLGREVLSSTRQTQLIGWRPNDEGLAAAGGVIRTNTGRFVKAFTSNLRSCSITRAEMQAIVNGLQLAWNLGIRRIQVQSDSMTAISILAKDSELRHQHATLVIQFKELCSRQWEVTISHIYREANFAADYLANLGHSLPYGMHLFDSSDRGLSHWLHYDLFGISLTRFVRVSNNT
ncbi:Putative ribonuclease H protein At1g65750 [Linum grandiflorum]